MNKTPDVATTEPEVRYGYYSRRAENEFGSLKYNTPEGKTVIVTGTFRSKESAENGYGFADKVFVGITTTYVGVAIPCKKEYENNW